MNEGTKLIGTNNDDMVEFLQYIRRNGGECVCSDYDKKIVEVIRGTVNEDKICVYNGDGVLGRVDTSDAGPGEKTE